MKELEEARAALARGEYKQATEACTRAIERAPENLEARIVLVELCLACQRIDDALTVGEYILSQAGKAAEALQEAQREELQEAFAPYGRYASQRLAQRFPRVLAFLRARGILPAVETEMQDETAAQCETETRRKMETHHETETRAAAVPPRQEADAQEYLSSLPPAARIQSLRAEAGNYLAQGDAAAADTCLRQALFLDGKDDATLRARAIALWAMGRTQEALAAAGKCSLTDFSLLAKLQQTPPASAKDKAENQEQQGKRKKLLVFLPVDASMWDSLDSVWRAAAADPEHCRTLVIPLPFSDRNPDYSETVWQCDAADYPDDVPVEDWHDYPMERLMGMHPDVIFINIPYDDCNYVYSVDAQYYSRNLKYCTDNLVYIPYFVMGDTIPVNFCQVPAVIHADHVIVQDENIKRQYEQNYPDGEPPEGKFLALGSPKFDHVLRPREAFTLPAAWQRIIKGRKVILYNTSVTSALTNTAYVCRKLRSVLAYFKNRKDIAFWWRPHPFMEATLRSMRPSILQEYIAIRKQYQEEAWGIYDDTSDLDRAIVCSDAYYGDPSSVVWLYRETGKAMLIQMYYYPTFPFYVTNISMAGGAGWFFDTFRDHLWEIDFNKQKIINEATLPSEYCLGIDSFGPVVRDGEKLILFPNGARKIIQYDLRTQVVQDVMELDNPYDISGRSLFCHAIRYRHAYYVYSVQSPIILKYDLQTHTFTQIKKWFEGIQDEYHYDVQNPWPKNNILRECTVVKNKMYITLPFCNALLELQLDTDDTQIYHVGENTHHYRDIDYDGDYFWLLDFDAQEPIIRWDKDADEIREYFGMKTYWKKNPVYAFLHCEKDQVVFYPCDADTMFSLDKKTGEIRIGEKVGGVYFLQKTGEGKAIWAQDGKDDIDFFAYDHAPQKIFSFSKGKLVNSTGVWRMNRRGYNEELSCPLDVFLSHLKEYDEQARAVRNIPLYGKRIYQAIVKSPEERYG